MLPQLSLVIPAYNVEKYILTCLKSIESQINKNVEVIIINDGSTDQTQSIIENFIKNLSNLQKKQFIFLSQTNKGVSTARNTGITLSSGNYIGFIDPDDYISTNYIELIENSLNYQPDIIQFNAYCFFEDTKNKDYTLNNFDKEYSNYRILDENLKKIIFNQNNWFSWLRIYKKDIFIKKQFPSNLSHFEDAYIVIDIISESKNIYIINENIYNYRISNNSSTRNICLDTKLKLLKSCETLIEKLIRNHSCNEIIGIPLIHFFYIYIEESKKIDNKKILIKNWNKYSKLISNLNINPQLIKNKNERFLLYFLKFNILGYFFAKKISKLFKNWI